MINVMLLSVALIEAEILFAAFGQKDLPAGRQVAANSRIPMLIIAYRFMLQNFLDYPLVFHKK